MTDGSGKLIAIAINDTVTLDRYILVSLIADLVESDRRLSVFLILLAIWTSGEGDRVALSYPDPARKTRLSKRPAQMAVAHPAQLGLLEVTRLVRRTRRATSR